MNKGNPLKILIVDDEEYVLSFFRNIIHLLIHMPGELKVSIELTTETSPVRALETLRNEKYNIFVIDYAMPEMNGIKLLTKIRQRYKKKYVPIFITAVGTIGQFKAEQKDELFQYYLEKPVDQSLAIGVLKQAIHKNLGNGK